MFKSKQKLLAKVIMTVVSFLYVTSIFSLLFLTPSTSETALAQNNPSNPNAPGYLTPLPPPAPPVTTPPPPAAVTTGTNGQPATTQTGGSGETPTVGDPNSWQMMLYNGLVIGFFGYIVGLSGLLFDTSLQYFIIEFGVFYNERGIGVAVESTWGIVRDVFNLTFIFGIIYIGFRMILNSDDSNAKRTLVTLLAAALLVNFSLFITKFVVDFSNILAAEIYQAISSAGTTSATFLGLLRLSTVTAITNLNTDVGNIMLMSFGSIILFLVAFFVLISGAILIAIRFIVLLIYMIFSPIMFLGWVFPNMAGQSRKFFQDFLKKAFFAPAYLFMLYLSFKIMGSYFQQPDFELSQIFTPGATTNIPAILTYFMLSCGLMLASLVVAQKMGAHGADTAISIGQKAQKRLRGGLTYMPRAVTRMGINAGGEWAEKRLNNLQVGDGAIAKILRTNTVDRTLRGATTSATNAKFGTVASNKENRDYKDKTRSRANQTEAERNRDQAVVNAEKAFNSTATSATDLNTALENLAKNVSKMTNDELGGLGYSKLTQTHYAANLSDSQIDSLEKSGKYSASQIQSIKDARKDGMKSIAARGHALPASLPASGISLTAANIDHSRAKLLADKSVQEIGKMPLEIFKEKEMYKYISPAMLEMRIRNGIADADRMAIVEKMLEGLGITTAVSTPADGYMALRLAATGGNSKAKMWIKWADGNSAYAAQFFS